MPILESYGAIGERLRQTKAGEPEFLRLQGEAAELATKISISATYVYHILTNEGKAADWTEEERKRAEEYLKELENACGGKDDVAKELSGLENPDEEAICEALLKTSVRFERLAANNRNALKIFGSKSDTS